jgi:5-methylcytosine-specific restriction endonuclease McrA
MESHMPASKNLNAAQKAKILGQLHRDVEARRNSYRSRALKLFPHVCGSCSREFEGRRLNELEVHHKDHDHKNNPADGSNWELLCTYCHDNEHEKDKLKGYGGAADKKPTLNNDFQAFAGLDSLFTAKEDASS